LLAVVTAIATCSIPGTTIAAGAEYHGASTTPSIEHHQSSGLHSAVGFSATKARIRIRSADRHPYVAPGGIWLSLRRCESHDNYREDSGNGYYGAYQFSTSTWHIIGQIGIPNRASPQIQDAAARTLLNRQGWVAWPSCAWQIGVA
jgi:hypothetical protein